MIPPLTHFVVSQEERKMSKVTTATLQQRKQNKQPITMITAYDYPTAKLVEQAEIDVILVGDSLGMVVLGYDSTIPVTIDDMVHHTKAVSRGVTKTLVVADLPFLTYHGSFDQTLHAASRLMQEAGAHVVKLEGGQEIFETVYRLTSAGVPVMGHIGLTPQSVHQLGGYKVQGKDMKSALKLVDDAHALQRAGVCSIVLECVPAPLAKIITEQLDIPTIGIGAGVDCDGQVLVVHDLVGFGDHTRPKFVKQYAQIGDQVVQSTKHYIEEVLKRKFPAEEHTFSMDPKILDQLLEGKADL